MRNAIASTGHLVQVFHILMIPVWIFTYTAFNLWWFFIGGVVVVVGANILFGTCPITILSNKLLKIAKEEEYPTAFEWLKSWTGTGIAILILVLSLVISITTGNLVRFP